MGECLNVEQASERFNVAKGQMKEWLKRLCDDEILIYKQGLL